MNEKQVEEAWPQLADADRTRNAGMPMELISAEGYARMDGETLEGYVIKVLRQSRDARQELDRRTSDNEQIAEMFERAADNSMSVIDYVAGMYGNGEPRNLSPVYLARLVRYLEATGR